MPGAPRASALARHCDEMRARSDDRRLFFYFREHLKKSLALRGVGEGRAEGGGPPGRSLDAENLDIAEIDVLNFRAQLLGAVKIGGREVIRGVRRIAMLTGREVASHQLPELLIGKETGGEPIHQGRVAADRGG